MNVRDALEADADALASIADSPTDVMRNLVHDRTVRVAESSAPTAESSVSSENTQYGESDPEDLLGFVSFDAREDTVHITQIGGTEDACERLLGEPVRFAEREGMTVELLIPPSAAVARSAATNLGFTEIGAGPRFDGTRTIRFQYDPHPSE